MTAALVERVARVRLTPEQYVEKVARGRLGRRDFLVLRAIAKRAHWQSWRWGEGSIRCVENIARDVDYCERSVQYAYRSLEEAGWLAIEPRPGRTNHFRILRPVEPLGLVVDDDDGSVDDVGDNRPPDGAAASALVAPGGATVAPDLGTPTRDHPPDSPRSGSGESGGAVAPAQPRRPMRRGGASPPSRSSASRSAAVGAQPHRGMRGAGVAAGSPPPLQDGPAAAVSEPSADDEPGGRLSRLRALQTRRCPRCGASPGEACRNRSGRLRKANHHERRAPDVYGPAARAGLWRSPRAPDDPLF